MAQRRVGQLGWVDAAVASRPGKRPDVLGEVSRLVEWGRFERLLPEVSASRPGEAAYPSLVLLKVVLLQRWYSLSDPGMEEALADRLSFRRFVGLSLADETPDHSTIWRFRERLCREGRIDDVLAEVSRQLDRHGVLLRQGTLIDASLIASAARRPRMDEDKVSPVDPDARFGTNNERRRYAFGYKAHIAVDQISGLVRGLKLTPANIQEVTVARDLIQGDEGAVYADRGYDGKALHDHLARQGIADGIMRRGQREQPLTPELVARNHQLSLRRRPVEAVFGTLKRSYRLARMPYFRMTRNHLAVALACFAYNLKRLRVLATP